MLIPLPDLFIWNVTKNHNAKFIIMLFYFINRDYYFREKLKEKISTFTHDKMIKLVTDKKLKKTLLVKNEFFKVKYNAIT